MMNDDLDRFSTSTRSRPRSMTHTRCHRRFLSFVVLVVALVTAPVGCATGPQVGVRGSYDNTRIQAATVVPFFSRAAFSLAPETLDERLGWAQSVALEWLAEHGVRVVSPDRARDRLVQASQWEEHFTDGGLLRRDLATSFESADRDQKKKSQVELLRRLHENGHLEGRFLLFGELLYHSAGTCHTRADAHTDRSRVVVADGVPASLPRPCIVTHFQARLVDIETGSTVWYNRRMREWHVDEVGRDRERANIRNVVRAAIGGDDGLERLFEQDAS